VVEALKKMAGTGNARLGSRAAGMQRFKDMQLKLRQARTAPLWAATVAAAQAGEGEEDVALPSYEVMSKNRFYTEYCGKILYVYQGEVGSCAALYLGGLYSIPTCLVHNSCRPDSCMHWCLTVA
jgi:hypothetical protein